MTKHFNKTSEKEKRRKLRREQTLCEKILWIYLRDRKTLGYKFRNRFKFLELFIATTFGEAMPVAQVVEFEGQTIIWL